MANIANSVNTNIQTTTDTPEKNDNSRMPVIGLKVWMRKVEGVPVVTHSFCKKIMASKFTIMKRSAVAAGTKKSTTF